MGGRTFAVQCASLAFAVCVGVGCASTATSRANEAMTKTQPTLELLGFPDCPHTAPLRDSLAAALAAMGFGWTFADIDQEALPEGDLRRGYPAPTILIDGRDLFGLPAPTSPSLGCRVYPGGVPDAGLVAERLRVAALRRRG